MERNVWDPYADWGDVAKSESAAEVKAKITGRGEIWQPNVVSDALLAVIRDIVSSAAKDESGPVTVVDFGCGLGRNLPLLRRLFPRVVALDIPDMISRLRGEQAGADARVHYDEIYDDIDALLSAEQVHIVYDSVVFQHIVDRVYVTGLVDRLMTSPSFSAVVSLSFIEYSVAALDVLVGEYRWKSVYSEIDNASFVGSPHQVKVVRRPARWSLELRDGVIGITPEFGEWRPVIINGAWARASADWQTAGLVTALSPILMILFERQGTQTAWFVEESGRHIAGSVDSLPERIRMAIASDLREMLGPWLRRKFNGAGPVISNALLELVAPSIRS
jgi:SAM-dependent methyltransferase